jgi:hypothetical protein
MVARNCTRGLPMLFGAFVCTYACGEGSLDSWAAVDANRLDELRGGFETSDGMRVAFAIERSAYINGELVAHTSAVIPDIANMTTQQAEAFSEATKVLLVQNGPNNQFDVTGLSPGSTVIQNTLNDQLIVTTTTLSAEANSLAMFQGLNLHESLQQALENVAGPR